MPAFAVVERGIDAQVGSQVEDAGLGRVLDDDVDRLCREGLRQGRPRLSVIPGSVDVGATVTGAAIIEDPALAGGGPFFVGDDNAWGAGTGTALTGAPLIFDPAGATSASAATATPVRNIFRIFDRDESNDFSMAYRHFQPDFLASRRL